MRTDSSSWISELEITRPLQPLAGHVPLADSRPIGPIIIDGAMPPNFVAVSVSNVVFSHLVVAALGYMRAQVFRLKPAVESLTTSVVGWPAWQAAPIKGLAAFRSEKSAHALRYPRFIDSIVDQHRSGTPPQNLPNKLDRIRKLSRQRGPNRRWSGPRQKWLS